MKLRCTRCGRYGIKMCNQPLCPPGTLSPCFEIDNRIQDMRITRGVLGWFRTSALYAAERNGKPIFLKIAHDGWENQLKREAKTMVENAGHPALPRVLPAYPDRNDYYGKAPYDGERYYVVYDYIEGQFLSTYLNKTPYPVVKQSVWMAIALSHAISQIHKKSGLLVACLRPQSILVTSDKIEGIEVLHPILLDLGAAESPSALSPDWFAKFDVADYAIYMPPEGLDPQWRRGKYDARTDVYEIGLLLYELISGHPAYSVPENIGFNEMRQIIWGTSMPPPLPHKSTRNVEALVRTALSRVPDKRQRSLSALRRDLTTISGPIPLPQRWITRFLCRRIVRIGLLMGLILLIVLIIFVLLNLIL